MIKERYSLRQLKKGSGKASCLEFPCRLMKYRHMYIGKKARVNCFTFFHNMCTSVRMIVYNECTVQYYFLFQLRSILLSIMNYHDPFRSILTKNALIFKSVHLFSIGWTLKSQMDLNS